MDVFRSKLPPEPPDMDGFGSSSDPEKLQSLNLTTNRSFKEVLPMTSASPLPSGSSGKDVTGASASPSFLNPPPPSTPVTATAASAPMSAPAPKKHGFSIEEIMRR